MLISAMRAHGCKKIVFSSSATVYGVNNPAPYVETMPTNSSTNPYGYTKVMIEQILKDVFTAKQRMVRFSAQILQSYRCSQERTYRRGSKRNSQQPLPLYRSGSFRKLERLGVFGNDYDTPDGTGVRDYIHVVDLASGHLCAVKYVLEHKGVEAVNLGTGKGSSVMDVLHAFERACGKKIPYQIMPRRAGDIAVCYANTDKAKELFGWEAQYGLDEMAADGWNFTRNNPNGL